MTDAEVSAGLHALAAEVAALRRAVERLAPPPPPAHAELVDELGQHFDSAFTSSEVASLAKVPLSTRAPLRRLLDRLGAGADAQKVGMLLSAVAKSTKCRPHRLVRVGREAGSTLWAVEREPGG